MIYSFSRLQLYEICPYRFYQKYVMGIEEPVTKPLALGKAVHKGNELIINKGLSLEEATYEGLLEVDFHPEVTYVETFRLIKNAPVYQGMGETELHFQLPLADSPDAPIIQGYIDLVNQNKIVDWKTNWKMYHVLENYQLSIYAWAMMKLKGVSKVNGSLYFLRYRKSSTHTFTLEDTEKARKWAYDLAIEIKMKVFLSEIEPDAISRLFPPKPSSNCSHCSFSLECYQKFGRVFNDSSSFRCVNH